MKTRLIILLGLSSALCLSACQSTKTLLGKRDNGSLDYRQTQKLDPILLPQEQRAPMPIFVPIYDTPDITSEQVDPFTNATGTQYQLPKPPTVR